MSFTSKIKEEVCNLTTTKTDEISELSALIRNLGIIYPNYFQIITENENVSSHIFNLLQRNYDITPRITVRRGYNFNKNLQYILEVKQKKEEILEDLSIIENGKMSMIPKTYIYDDFELKRDYLRGVFLSCGSMNDPKTSRYHLEFVFSDFEYAEFIQEI